MSRWQVIIAGSSWDRQGAGRVAGWSGMDTCPWRFWVREVDLSLGGELCAAVVAEDGLECLERLALMILIGGA